jgi:hypothetical protein
MKGSIVLSWGKWGGFYYEPGKTITRLCLGFIAFTYIPYDFDDWWRAILMVGEPESDQSTGGFGD